jgi:hypothetical protein
MNINLHLSVGWWTLWLAIWLVGFWVDYISARRVGLNWLVAFALALIWPLLLVASVGLASIAFSAWFVVALIWLLRRRV